MVSTLDDRGEIADVFDILPFEPGRPNCVIAHTVKGKGTSFAEDSHLWHANTVTDEVYERALAELGEGS